ncbi:hypothetical protein N9L06_06920, partial [Mariniblastus sp.]|nr:hypothetical protein [Mariniblastus sp.]
KKVTDPEGGRSEPPLLHRFLKQFSNEAHRIAQSQFGFETFRKAGSSLIRICIFSSRNVSMRVPPWQRIFIDRIQSKISAYLCAFCEAVIKRSFSICLGSTIA